ncbi:hypothetical protein GCM10008101_27880 [Lysobacter xinjiangensis]|uniref:Uncharacterized protein n=1 Tax=Cognatilysobacter xinjiangensis TaxID=546892 RepID=A0ABQ3C7I5_9GAMM|nr:hypothetical protein GCM10008101_27880 [Lysobacter xinjiangensis]
MREPPAAGLSRLVRDLGQRCDDQSVFCPVDVEHLMLDLESMAPGHRLPDLLAHPQPTAQKPNLFLDCPVLGTNAPPDQKYELAKKLLNHPFTDRSIKRREIRRGRSSNRQIQCMSQHAN